MTPTGSGPGTGAVLSLDGITRRFGSVVALDHLSLSIHAGEFITLLGPSGCGKTTALRIIAGFEEADSGTLRFRGEDVTRFTPQRRGFGMVFQNYALFPHLSVGQNVAFGLQARKRPTAEIRTRVASALDRVDLAGYQDRPVQALSGGQQQRVALARALAIEPPLLLLDEPLSNLDAALRERTRTEIRRLVKELGITALFVTHDQEEAFDLSDRIAVMSAGQLRQMGTPEELYLEPADRFVAGFVGRANLLTVRVHRRSAEGVHGVELPGGAVWSGRGVRLADGGSPVESEEYVLMIRPEELRLVSAEAEGALRGTVIDRRFRGALTASVVRLPGGELLEVADGGAAGRPGDSVGVIPSPGGALHLFRGKA